MELLNSFLKKWNPSDGISVPERDCVGCRQLGKCCDFQPFVANFLLGAWLELGHALPAPKEHFYSPLGLIPGESFRLRHARTEKSKRGEDLHCLFYQRESCAIWSLRPGECSLYFCDSEDPFRSQLSKKSFAFETRFAQMALEAQGFGLEAVHLMIDELNLERSSTSYPLEDVMGVYRRAWDWARQVKRDQVEDRI